MSPSTDTSAAVRATNGDYGSGWRDQHRVLGAGR